MLFVGNGLLGVASNYKFAKQSIYILGPYYTMVEECGRRGSVSDFAIKEIIGDDIERYWRLACCSFHMVQPGFGTEEHKAKLWDNEEKKAREVSSLGGNRSVLTGFFKYDRLVAGMRIVASTSHFDRNRCEMGGVGGVLSDPEFRKTGGVSSLFRYNLATEKTDLMWERYFKDKEPCSTPFFSYLHYTDGKPDGFFS